MAATHLKVYHGPETDENEEFSVDTERRTITLPAGEIIPLLVDAYTCRRTWLADFENDSVSLPADLYEVLVAYQFFNRPSA